MEAEKDVLLEKMEADTGKMGQEREGILVIDRDQSTFLGDH